MALRSHLLAAARFGPYAVGETTMAEELWPELSRRLALHRRPRVPRRECLSAIEDQDRNRHWMTRAKSRSRWRTVKRLGRATNWSSWSSPTKRAARIPKCPSAGWCARFAMSALASSRRRCSPRSTTTRNSRPRNGRALSRALGAGARLRRGQDELLEREEALRSKTPRASPQDLWSLGLLYNLVRLEMEQIAVEAGVPPTRISFIAALQFIQNCWLICAAMARPASA